MHWRYQVVRSTVAPMSTHPPDQTVWQENDGWHVRLKPDGPITVFKTRDEAIAFSVSAFTDGGSAARAETMSGDAQMPANPVEKSDD